MEAFFETYLKYIIIAIIAFLIVLLAWWLYKHSKFVNASFTKSYTSSSNNDKKEADGKVKSTENNPNSNTPST